MEAVEDFESRPHQATTFVVERDKEIQELREQHMPKHVPGFSGAKLPGRSKTEEGEEEEEEEDGKEKPEKKWRV